MLSIIFTLVIFIVLLGLTIVVIEAHNAPLMADDEVTVATSKRKGDSTNV